ncbi:hypothetical protein LIA77_09021 [Sarocladium implicatum]|nr:hypothetical protein LIA77_09021 [Sarocladium implicatum]
MAAIPPARTRSLRANAPNLRHPREQQQYHSNGNGPTTAASTSNFSSTTRSAQHASANALAQGPSPLSLFLTNLRLLDLDLLPDWPGMTAATFVTVGSGTGAAQGQKKRVACVEWALFRLFEIYDADEARNKLQPFFPPRDQVQSVNLRAALLRGLEAAKKAGVLGKDTILRKTMLDDCKGERLEEVLAAFSTAVLRMVVSQEEGADATPAMTLALENRGYKDDKTDLTVLILAHRVSLCKTLKQRKEAGVRYKDFEDLLGLKEKGLMRRREEVKALNEADEQRKCGKVSKEAAREMRHTVRNNWAGNEQWMETLLHGEAKSAGDRTGLFGMPFDRVWRRVEQSRLTELEESGVSLLEQLERRVRGHEERLAKWERFRDGMRGSRQAPSRTKKAAAEMQSKASGLNLGFGAHESLQVGMINDQARERVVATLQQKELRSKQDEFFRRLDRDLESASGTNAGPRESLGFLFDRRPAVKTQGRLSAPDADHEAVSEISDFEDNYGADVAPEPVEPPKPVAQMKAALLKRLPERPKLTQPMGSFSRDAEEEELDTQQPSRTQKLGQAPKLPRPGRTMSYDDEGSDLPMDKPIRTKSKSSARSSANGRSRSISPAKEAQPLEVTLQQHDSPEPTQNEPMAPVKEQEAPRSPISPAQDAADEILESMKNASPSPAKLSRPRHKLSLAERTRMSMARGSLLFAEEDEDEDPMGKGQASAISPALDTAEQGESEIEPVEDLVSRTRRSMAGFEKARQKAQIDRRRSIRKSKAMGPPIKEGSYFPKLTEEGDGGMLAEELMAEEDMEAVFRSRPKIQASPIPSPTREWED